ncbi:MAG: hypothetical protein GY874_02810 [Desulfobacteraceae bacterium]|nr:hypothetical protein [Desulfobacteraceae bacterium]
MDLVNLHKIRMETGTTQVHVHTMEECFWSLLISWLRPHRGISKEKLPFYLEFFEYVHNMRKRAKALLHSLIQVHVKYDPETQHESFFFSVILKLSEALKQLYDSIIINNPSAKDRGA